MVYNTIDSCRICKCQNLKEVINLGNQGLASVFPKIDDPDPNVVPLVLVRCSNIECGLLQLKHTVDNNEMYEQPYGYRSGINNTMKTHLYNLVRTIRELVDLKNDDYVLDIGSNDATLLKFYGDEINKIGVDPTGTQFKDFYTDDITLYSTYFTAGLFTQKVKVVTSISMFYDLPEPVQFMKDVKSILHEDGVWVMEQSYMPDMLKLNSFDTICHEHLEYYALKQIVYMCNLSELQIFDIEFNTCNGGSFRVYITHKGSNTYTINYEIINETLKTEQTLNLDSDEIYSEFNARCDEIKHEFFKVIKGFPMDQVYLYGASTKGNTLLQHWGVDNTIVKGAAERNPRKFGCKTPNTNIPIVSEEEMRSVNPKCLIVLPWHFKDEFIQREHAYLAQGGTMVFPLPRLSVVKYNTINVPVSYGELLDKITILEIKLENIKNDTALYNIKNELHMLTSLLPDNLETFKTKLKDVNKIIWDTEEALHTFEKTEKFDNDFIQMARNAYNTNDKRAAIKKEVNIFVGSTILEEKSFNY